MFCEQKELCVLLKTVLPKRKCFFNDNLKDTFLQNKKKQISKMLITA